MRTMGKCPLCNHSMAGISPAYQRVYFSVLEGNGDDKSALMAVKKELATAQDEIDTLNREYDDLALKWTVAKDELNAIQSEKTQLEKDSALKDAQIDKLTHNWQTSKARNKDDINTMNLKLISKQKSIDLLSKNLHKSNKRIKSLKDELDALKPAGNQDSTFTPKSRYRDQNFKSKYYDLNKDHRALKDKMSQLEKKFIDLTLKTPSPSSSSLVSKTEKSLQSNIQLLEKQLHTSITKEQELVKEVTRFEQLEQDAVKEKKELQAKLANAEAKVASLERGGDQKDESPRQETECLLG